MMKRFFQILVFLLLAQITVAQKNDSTKTLAKKPRHEVRIIMENMFERPINFQNYSYPVTFNGYGTFSEYKIFVEQFKYGFGYNYNWSKIGLRSRFLLSNYQETYSVRDNSVTDVEGGDFRFSLGVNYQKSMDKILIFAGIDISIFSIENSHTTNTDQGGGVFYKSEYKNKIEGMGIEPLVGFKYFLNQNFSFSSEIRLIIDGYEGESISSDFNPITGDKIEFTTNFEGGYNSFGPRGTISFNIHF